MKGVEEDRIRGFEFQPLYGFVSNPGLSFLLISLISLSLSLSLSLFGTSVCYILTCDVYYMLLYAGEVHALTDKDKTGGGERCPLISWHVSGVCVALHFCFITCWGLRFHDPEGREIIFGTLAVHFIQKITSWKRFMMLNLIRF